MTQLANTLSSILFIPDLPNILTLVWSNRPPIKGSLSFLPLLPSAAALECDLPAFPTNDESQRKRSPGQLDRPSKASVHQPKPALRPQLMGDEPGSGSWSSSCMCVGRPGVLSWDVLDHSYTDGCLSTCWFCSKRWGVSKLKQDFGGKNTEHLGSRKFVYLWGRVTRNSCGLCLLSQYNN